MSSPAYWQLQAPAAARPALEGALTREVCVIGAGISGAACAWRLLEHGVSVTMLEADVAAASASGRNGGFAVTGLGLHGEEVSARFGAEMAAELLRATAAALEQMAARAEELGVADAVRRTGSLRLGLEEERASLEAEHEEMRAAGLPCAWAPEMIPAGLRERFALALHFPDHGALQPARWVRALAAGAADRGAEVFGGSPVTAIEDGGEGWVVRTPGGSVTAQAVVIATDGLIPRILPELDGVIYPVRGQVVATEPVAREVLPCPTGALQGFIYGQQVPSGEVVLGGFRHVDLEAEYTDELAVTTPVQQALDGFLRQELGLEGVAVTHRWAGIMGFSADLLPLAGELPERPGLCVCGGYSGAGNVLGHLCGGLVADLIATGAHPQAAVFDPARV